MHFAARGAKHHVNRQFDFIKKSSTKIKTVKQATGRSAERFQAFVK